jgi:glycosyltransferase involved in cell wall biosynthesis
LSDTVSDKVKVTVGLCVKNSEDVVRKAIDSVLFQGFPHKSTELIIVDGNSRDKTLNILKESLASTNLKFRIFSENSGLGMARQLVVEKARGEYIVWVDADMVLPQSYILNQVTFMDDHPKVGIAAGKYAIYIGQGTAADLENIVYAVDSAYGEKSASEFGYLPGAEGSIFRVKAIRQIGGFDIRMNGAAEDTEIAYRMRNSGWELAKTKEMFVESTRTSWSSLWAQYVWYGRGGHFIFHKHSKAISLWKMTPIAGFLAGLLRFPKAYLLAHRKVIFLLPFHYTYKRIAWFFGFISAHLDGYGHFRS